MNVDTTLRIRSCRAIDTYLAEIGKPLGMSAEDVALHLIRGGIHDAAKAGRVTLTDWRTPKTRRL